MCRSLCRRALLGGRACAGLDAAVGSPPFAMSASQKGLSELGVGAAPSRPTRDMPQAHPPGKAGPLRPPGAELSWGRPGGLQGRPRGQGQSFLSGRCRGQLPPGRPLSPPAARHAGVCIRASVGVGVGVGRGPVGREWPAGPGGKADSGWAVCGRRRSRCISKRLSRCGRCRGADRSANSSSRRPPSAALLRLLRPGWYVRVPRVRPGRGRRAPHAARPSAPHATWVPEETLGQQRPPPSLAGSGPALGPLTTNAAFGKAIFSRV